MGTLGVAALLLVTGCGLNPDTEKTSGATQKELTIGIGQLAPSVDIHVDTASTSRNTLNNVYDRLVVPDFKGGWLPSVATKWEFDDAFSELTFTLRDDVSFTNGEKLDAAAVKYSLERQLNPANKAYALGTVSAKFTGAEVIDNTHVKFLVKNNDATAMSALSQVYLVPPKHSEATGMGMNGEGVGSGPMMIESFTANDHMTLVPNPHYWGEPIKNLTKVTWLSIKDEAARSSALDSGRADIVFPLSPDIWSHLDKSKVAAPYSAMLGQYQNLFLGKYDQDTPLKDVRVRQAVNYAINKQMIVDTILKKTTEVPSQMVPQGSSGYDSSLKPFPYDPSRAKQLLADAGYPNGFSITMESTAGRTPGDREVAAAIVDMLKDVGIQVKWTPLPATEWLTKFVNGKGAPLFMLNTSIEPAMMPESGFTQWTTGSFTKVMSDKAYDDAVAKMLHMKSETERSAAIRELSAMVLEKQPVAMLYIVPMLYGVNRHVHGFEGAPDLSFDLHDITIDG